MFAIAGMVANHLLILINFELSVFAEWSQVLFGLMQL